MTNKLKEQDILDVLGFERTVRLPCPFCLRKDTLTVTKQDSGYVYNCYNAACDTRGFVQVREDYLTLANRIVQKPILRHLTGEEQEYRLPTYLTHINSSPWALEWLVKNGAYNGLKSGKYKVWYDPREDRLCVPLYNRKGTKILNLMGRKGPNSFGPKVKIYNKGGVKPPFVVGTGSTLVIVEDFASAVRVSDLGDVIGFALLGVTFDINNFLPYLKDITSVKKILVCLDKDALTLSIKVCNVLQSLINLPIEVVALKDKDLKLIDSDYELKETLRL